MYRFIQIAYPPQLVDYIIYVIDQRMAEIFVAVSDRMTVAVSNAAEPIGR